MTNSNQSLASLFRKTLTSIQEGSSNTEELKAQFRKQLMSTGKSPAPKVVKITPVSQLKKKKKAKPAAKSSQKAKPKTKPNQMARASKKELYADTIENRIEAQREARKGGKIMSFAKKVKSSIYDKVQKQRKEREAKPKKVEKPKDPKKVKSKPFRIGK